MGLEAVTYISDLVITNPVGATDPKSQGDDHIRNIKKAVKQSFPNVAGAVSADHTELSLLDGATGLTGTGNTVRSASPTFTGTVTAATVAATTLTGAGSGITALNASNLASGTVPDARFPSTLPALNGSALTALNASNLGSGTVPDARFPSTLPALNGSALTSLNGSNVASGTVADARLSSQVVLKDSDLATLANTSAAHPGYRGTPDVSMTSTLTMTAAHAGCRIFYGGAGGHSYKLPGGTGIPEGTVIRVINFGGGAITIDATTNGETMYLIGAGGAAGNRSLAVYGACTLERITTGSDQRWMISGIGLT